MRFILKHVEDFKHELTFIERDFSHFWNWQAKFFALNPNFQPLIYLHFKRHFKHALLLDKYLKCNILLFFSFRQSWLSFILLGREVAQILNCFNYIMHSLIFSGKINITTNSIKSGHYTNFFLKICPRLI